MVAGNPVKEAVKVKSREDLENIRKDILKKRDSTKLTVTICSGTGCRAYGSVNVYDTFVAEIAKQGLGDKVTMRSTGCHGFCERGTIVVIFPEEICYLRVKPEDVTEIVSETLLNGKIIDRLLYEDENGQKLTHESDIPFYKLQNRIVFGNNKYVDPQNIEDYLALGGYSALSKVLSGMTPEQVIDEVKKANLRGRGGGGFSAGVKWETTRNAPGNIKYVIVNADEGDPGAYMDRSLLEGNPHSVLEGLIIGGYAIGANQGYVYVRQEYPLAVENLYVALEQAREYGFIGTDIMGSGFNFDVAVHKGAGAFVSGESSALMSAIEGNVGEPRPKYIRTAVSGIWERPSNLNNVETWATVPLILNNGADWFKSIGTENSSGTKIFSLVGKVNNTGLVEVPMGITLREIIYDIGGGIPGGKKFKAVQTGGPSGGVLPESMLDIKVDFDELSRIGSMMGSGGMIVMDETTCMVDVARYFLDFLTDESCGKCTPCREGVHLMLRILNRICSGNGEEGDIEKLEEIAGTVQVAAHIKEKRCPAGVCKSLISYNIQVDKCKGCGICLRNCPVNAISGEKQKPHTINQAKCTKCGTCLEVCPERFGAVIKLSGGKPVEIAGAR
jgi:NADH:ubiquinone oxidoreductase subunit F (NADH-binding)/(2Fe-2S) ferredoxin